MVYFKEGDRIVTVGNVGTHRGYSYVGAKFYVAFKRKSDGKLIWKCDGKLSQYRSKAKATKDAMETGLPFITGIVANKTVPTKETVLIRELRST